MHLTETSVSTLLNEPNPFKISYTIADKQLATSVKQDGLREPLSAFKYDDTIFLFDGFKRAQLFADQPKKKLPCLIYEVTDAIEAFTQFATFQPNDLPAAKKASVLAKMKLLFPEIPAQLRQRFGIPRHKNDLLLLDELATLPANILCYLEESGCSTNQLRNLIRIDKSLGERFLSGIAQPLLLNANQLRKLMEVFADIELAFKTGIQTLKECEQILKASENRKEALQQITELLETQRRPNYSKTLASFQEQKKELFPPEVKVDPHNFDGEKLSFSFSATTPEQAAKTASAIASACNHKNAKKLFRFMDPC